MPSAALKRSMLSSSQIISQNKKECVFIKPDDKIKILIHQTIIPNEMENVFIHPDHNSDQKGECYHAAWS